MSKECAVMYWIRASALAASAYRSESGSSSAARHSPYRLSQKTDQRGVVVKEAGDAGGLSGRGNSGHEILPGIRSGVPSSVDGVDGMS